MPSPPIGKTVSDQDLGLDEIQAKNLDKVYGQEQGDLANSVQ